jgi:DNA-directed RNA polymerase subunit RPC12/RpoP
MPEQPDRWPRGAAWTLMNAQEVGQIARIRCGYCNIKRFYKPRELREVIGNVTIDQVRAKVRCQKCGRNESMNAELFHPVGQELETIRFRRLVEIRWEKRVIWKDE